MSPGGHLYYYYPDAQMYSCETHGDWWMLRAGAWFDSKTADTTVDLVTARKVNVVVPSDQPYMDYDLHRGTHGGR